jgi:hypothetical protein
MLQCSMPNGAFDVGFTSKAVIPLLDADELAVSVR